MTATDSTVLDDEEALAGAQEAVAVRGDLFTVLAVLSQREISPLMGGASEGGEVGGGVKIKRVRAQKFVVIATSPGATDG